MILNDDVGESVAVFFLLNEIPQMQRRKKKRNIHILSPDIHGLFVVMFDSCHYQFGDHAKYIHRRWTLPFIEKDTLCNQTALSMFCWILVPKTTR